MHRALSAIIFGKCLAMKGCKFSFHFFGFVSPVILFKLVENYKLSYVTQIYLQLKNEDSKECNNSPSIQCKLEFDQNNYPQVSENQEQ